jgi:hypothetical protein
VTSKVFTLEFKNGKLTIPLEIQDYLEKCQGQVKVSLMVESSSKEDNLSNAWNQWFQEVEEIEPIDNNEPLNDYQKLLIDKYKQQGLEL